MLINKKRYDAVGFGPSSIDYTCLVNGFSNGMNSREIQEFKVFGGGIVPTALVALKRLGGTCSLISKLGKDWMGERIIDELKSEGIDCSEVSFVDKPSSPFSFIQVDKNTGERAITYYLGAGKLLSFKDRHEKFVKMAKVLLLDGTGKEDYLKIARFAQSNEVKVMVDAHTVEEGINDLLDCTDYLIMSKQFMVDYSGEEDIKDSLRKIHERHKIKTIIVTLGEDGSASYLEGEYKEVNGFKVNVVDTTGAGDVFHGAFIFGIIKEWNIEDIMIFSSAVSAIKCTKYGGRPGIPDLKTVLKFLNDRGIRINKS